MSIVRRVPLPGSSRFEQIISAVVQPTCLLAIARHADPSGKSVIIAPRAFPALTFAVAIQPMRELRLSYTSNKTVHSARQGIARNITRFTGIYGLKAL